MKKIRFLMLGFLLAFLLPMTLLAQPLSYENTADVILEDGTIVKVYGTIGNSNNYYYLPPNSSVRLSQNEGGDFEFNITNYTTNERTENGGIQGALLHFLFEWGLFPEQLENLKEQVQENLGGNLRGPVDFQLADAGTYSIKSGIMENDEFSSKTLHTGYAPPMPGSKAAVATKLNKFGAQLMENSFKSDAAIADLSVELVFEYIVLIKAAEGTITYNWELFQEQHESLSHEYLKKELDGYTYQWDDALAAFNANLSEMEGDCGLSSSLNSLLAAGKTADEIIGNTGGGGGSGGAYEYYQGEEEMREIYDFLSEEEVVELTWQRNITNEEIEVMETAFFNYFLNAFTDQDFPELISNDRIQIEGGENGVKQDAEGMYSFKGCAKMTSNRSKNKTIKFKEILLPIKRKHPMTFNLKSAYDNFQEEEKYFQDVILDDPFFEYRDINFILDADSEELFGEQINYVTINVRKKRSDGSVFEDKLTIDRSHLNRKGGKISTTYVRGDDTSEDQFEYKIQWSLRGGKVLPENPRWEKGDWEGITLAAPVKSRFLEFEADPGELEDLDVTRTSLQIKYQQFGKEKIETIQLSTRKEEFAKAQKIFSDLTNRDYSFRLIFNHKRLGKITTEWKDGYNDNYIYAIIPDALIEQENE